MVTWAFRPSALKGSFAVATASSLMALYLDDGRRAERNGFSIPNRDDASVESHGEHLGDNISGGEKSQRKRQGSFLRTCQWNIHFLSAPWLRENAGTNDPELAREGHAIRVAEEILAADADVIVLNEFGYSEGGRRGLFPALDALRSRLEAAGYSIHCAECSFPAAVASRLPVERVDKFRLDGSRAAVGVTVLAGGDKGDLHSAVGDDLGDGTAVTVYGIHLDDRDDAGGNTRLKEAETLIAEVNRRNDKRNRNILLVGDFNQQRREDYHPNEWKAICENKARRGSPCDDGVSSLLRKEQFRCTYDDCRDESRGIARNWTPGDPPPATHWTSTVVDYSYYQGGTSVSGVLVSPSNLSDHRMIVTDWRVHT